MLVGELFELHPDIGGIEFEYHGEPYDMLPLCIEGMSSNFYQAVLDSDIKLIDFINTPVKIVIDYHEVMDRYREIIKTETTFVGMPSTDFNSAYPNILDSPE